ncbi:microtubule associated-domain-containing protein, partial [Delphinella strobiligena]
MPPAVASSSIMSTPIPVLPQRGHGGPLDHGNILTLRDQEAKLDSLNKENFTLKLKIHYLEENLRRSGTEHQQETLKQNTELKELEIQTINRQLHIARAESKDQLEQAWKDAEQLKTDLKSQHAEALEALEDEIVVLESSLEEAETDKAALQDKIK